MDDFTVKTVLGVVCNLMVPVLLKALFVERFVECILPLVRKIVSYNSKPVAIISIIELPGQYRGEWYSAQHAMTLKE